MDSMQTYIFAGILFIYIDRFIPHQLLTDNGFFSAE